MEIVGGEEETSKRIGLQQPTVLWYLQCRVHEAHVPQVVQATEALCSWLLM